MASPEFHAFQERLASAPQPPPPADLNELRSRIEAALGAVPLADGVTATEVDAGGVGAIWTVRDDGADDDPVIVYFHGGGYRLCSARSYAPFGSHLAKACRARVLVVDYRLAPENPFPAAVDDALAAYRYVLDQGTPAGRVVIGGDSAGGGLTAALLLAAGDAGLDLPAGGVCLSPWADMTATAESYETRADVDKLFSLASAKEAGGLYLAGADPENPFASPVFGDWTGMPPILIQVGDAEVLLDDAATLAVRAREAGVEVVHEVYPEMPHVWMTNYPHFPEAVEAVEQIAAFVARVT